MKNDFEDYSIEVDSIEKATWEKLLQDFDDASIYQTWSWESISRRDKNLSHIVLKRKDEVVSMAQITINKLPFIGAGVASLFWGPMWRKKGKDVDYTVLHKMIEVLKNEYVTKRSFLLKILPIGFEKLADKTVHTLEQCGAIRDPKYQPYRTLILDLIPPIDEIRQNLLRKWRQALANAERFLSLELEYGKSDEHYKIALNIYNEMHDRKQFSEFVDMGSQGLIQKDLPESLKMKISICRLKSEPIAALGWSTIGEMGLPLIAATSSKALSLSTNASNLLSWEMIKDMKDQGCKFCDAGGIDPERNPGGYKFKMGFAGKSGIDVRHVGQFFIVSNPISRFLNSFINGTYYARNKVRQGLKLFYRQRI